jgi:glycosyltransferase involved in cell wall biosynthesis
MPVYNGEAFIVEAIESVIAQTYPHWELVVVDDGSTDATPQILDKYADRRIVTIRQDNAGEARARNVGLEHAKGPYIAFLDADDLYLPNALADLAEFLDVHPEYDVAFSDGYICDERGKALTRLSDIRPGVYTGDILEPLVLTAGVIAGVMCTMTRRSIVERHGVRFDESLVIGPDWDFWIQLARHARFGYLDQLTCMYRVHQTNVTRTSGLRKRKDDLVFGRMKVLNSDWFQELSVPTRQQFFYALLITLLDGQPTRQKAILESGQFQSLPAHVQAELWRHVGVDYLRKKSEPGFAIDCLQAALRIRPGDWKSRCLLWTLRLGISVPFSLLRLWRVAHRVVNRLRSLGHRPRPTPAGLGPVGD